MANKFIVHFVNPVSGWVTTIVHVVEADADSAVSAALVKFGLKPEDLGQTLKAIPQDLGPVAEAVGEDAVKEAEAVVEEHPVTSIPEAESDAVAAANAILANLPADVLAAIKAAAAKE